MAARLGHGGQQVPEVDGGRGGAAVPGVQRSFEEVGLVAFLADVVRLGPRAAPSEKRCM